MPTQEEGVCEVSRESRRSPGESEPSSHWRTESAEGAISAQIRILRCPTRAQETTLHNITLFLYHHKLSPLRISPYYYDTTLWTLHADLCVCVFAVA